MTTWNLEAGDITKCSVSSLETLCSLLLQPPATAVCLWVFLHSVLPSGIEMHNILCWDQVIDLITEKPREFLTWSDGVSLFFLTVVIILPSCTFFVLCDLPDLLLLRWPVHAFFLKMTQTVDLVTPKVLVIWFIWVFQPNVSPPFMYWHLIGPYIYTERINKNQI